MGLLTKVLNKLLAIDEFSFRMSFDKGVIGIYRLFTVSFGKSRKERNRNFVVEFFVDKVDNIIGNRRLS